MTTSIAHNGKSAYAATIDGTNIVIPPGVSEEIANERNYRRITNERQLNAYTQFLTLRQQQIPGLLIPVHKLGNPTPEFHVLRPDNPRMGYDGKMIKYEHPEGVPLCLDVLPRYRAALADPTVEVWITEGAKKADSLATAYGAAVVPININGVWGWRRRDHDGASHPLDDFDQIAWTGRNVVLAFDSDVTRKPEVQRALKALAHYLRDRGATVRVLVLPQDDDQKIGVDDALADGMTPDRLRSYIRSIDDLPRPDVETSRRYLTEDELDHRPPPTWLVDQEIAADGITVLYGASGSGKTFVALDYALRVAQDGAVMYVAAEDTTGLALRKRAWRAFHQTAAGTFYTWPEELNLLNTNGDVDSFIEQVRPLDVRLIVVDTLHQCMVGGDENSSRDMGIVIQSCKRIQRETGAGVLLVHHTGKNGASERGSSALRGAAYTMLELTNDDGLITLSCDKAKNSAPFVDKHLRLYEFAESCVIVPAESVIPSKSAPLTRSQRKVLEVLNLSTVVDVGAKASELGRVTGIPDSSLWRILATLKNRGFISQSIKGDPYYITDAGKAALNQTATPQLSSIPAQPYAQLSQLSPTLTNSHESTPPTPTPNSHQLSPPLRGESESRSESETGGQERDIPTGSDLDHDKRREAEIDTLLAQGKIKEAQRVATKIRGRKTQERIEAKIAAVAGGGGL